MKSGPRLRPHNELFVGPLLLITCIAEEFCRQAFYGFWPPMLVILEWLPEPEHSRRPKRFEYDGKRVEFSAAAEVAKHHDRNSHKGVPLASFRPVEHRCLTPKNTNDPVRHVLTPNRAIRSYDEGGLSPWKPRSPDNNV